MQSILAKDEVTFNDQLGDGKLMCLCTHSHVQYVLRNTNIKYDLPYVLCK